MSSMHSFSLHVKVFDKHALFESAVKRMMQDAQCEESYARQELAPDGDIDVDDCLRMLLDPGSFPGDGAQIEDSTCEFVSGDDDRD